MTTRETIITPMSVGSPHPRPLLLAGLLAALPFALLIAATARWGVDLPYLDDWDLVPLLVELDRGTLGFSDLWAPHDGHRPLFPRALLLATAAATDWNVRATLMLNVFLAAAIFLLAWRLLERTRRSVRPFSPPSWWLGPLTALAVFNLVQWESFLWGWQVQAFLMTTAMLAGFGLLADAADRWLVLGLATGLGVVASGSSSDGLLFWPLALILVARPAERRGARVLAWLVLSGTMIAAYLHELPRPSAESGIQGLDPVLHVVADVAFRIGSPVFLHVHHQAARWGGAVAVVAFVASAVLLLWRDPRRARTARWLWITVGAFALASATLSAVGRVHADGSDQVSAPLPMPTANLFWIALLGLLVTLPPARVPPRMARAAALGAAGLLLWQTFSGWALLTIASRERAAVRAAIIAGETADLSLVHASPEVVRQHLEVLDGLGMGPRRERASDGP